MYRDQNGPIRSTCGRLRSRAKTKTHKSCNFTILGSWRNPGGDRHESRREVSRTSLIVLNMICIGLEVSICEFLKNALSIHWKRPSPIQRCLALPRWHVIYYVLAYVIRSYSVFDGISILIDLLVGQKLFVHRPVVKLFCSALVKSVL
jgi:hypothetical protein